ncbi:uncharacterized protein LOC108633059 [Ceratina calcarata]|uniref:Uncharacterized protein LOC108633059 n=1 Tax=Ceratina calcarata TaxID=156304 RepID=A0AAJ7RX92_9HYME|nr:uncharacterized protein LOC108633059 [Ceratina calcarata]XP_017893512.1 uncharacterized protein LOC108633059 [Ceratina calcarata]XP_026666699.1 uncharacterized protein LOC108633059 [Ceratina calcarata]XP_026666700.1 uncharacterized protein LOC108633059 [Ceratina calcarata]
MSQPQLTTDLDVPKSPQHPCQCSAMSSIDSMRTQRDRAERSVGSTRISNNQELPRGLEALQSAFEPIRRLESPLTHQESQQINLENTRNVDILEHQAGLSPNARSIDGQSAILSRHSHNLSCSPRNLDLSRNLAFEAARRVQESSNLQDNQHSLTSSPSPLLESSSALLEPAAKDLDKQLEDHAGLSQKPTASSKDKLKNIQQVLNPYQHHHEPTSAERNVHGHFHGDAHAHVHKHADNFRNTTNLDVGDGLMGFQQHQRQHTHHHHGNTKTTNVTHHHGPATVHHPLGPQAMTGHHHGNLAPSLTSHVHGTTVPLTNPGSNHGSQNAPGNPATHHHPNPIPRNSPTSHHRLGGAATLSGHYPPNSGFSSDHHGTCSAMSGASSNSSMLNHGGSPAVHRHVVNTNSSLSTTPLASHHRGSSSGSLTGHSSVNHHHVSSGISCESSSSNANTRTHSRLDHVHDHHHHLQQVHSLHTGHPESRQRDRAPSSLEHHGHHHGHVHSHGHQHPSNNDTKNTSLIGVDSIQVSSPSKSKCQCHVMQTGGNKRGQEGESDGGVEVTSRTHQPPALPPRPPPRPTRRYETTSVNRCHTGEEGRCKKYVVLCCVCGGFSAAVGCLFLAVHAVLSAHTASLALFETVPSYIPGIMLILMGLLTMLLARRKHRYGLLMKVCGSVGVVCALVCMLVTVTTTVIHMSRLQGLRKCVYTAKAKSCTCYGTPEEDPGVRFEGTPHCEAVHGALHACLRALFGVSVGGILACIFSCMLVYQLLSHEKKKMYWEQLELRCRSLYGQGGTVGPATGSCGCCNDCGGASPWWTQTPGNLYTPNPDLAPSRRWRLPWSRSRGPAPSPDSNYGFHTQARQTEANVENANGPYSVLNSQSSGPYSVLNTQNGPYTPSTASYSVLETPVPLWGPPPPYSDPNSPARRPQVTEQRPRITKRIENFENNEDHRPRSTKRPSDNYENAEEISNSTDPEGGNEGTIKGRRIRKPLKGVENGAFQQEANPGPKQSESELYFGDVSSCCGPESSFYDLAVEKEAAEHPEGVDYLAARLGKRQLSKRSRMPLPLPSDNGDIPSDSYANSDEPRSTRGPFLAPDAQYEVIQQSRYSYYTSKDDEQLQEGPATSGYFREEDPDRSRERDYRDYRSSQEEETPQCCLSDSTTLDSGWQSGEQQQSDDNVRPVNV